MDVEQLVNMLTEVKAKYPELSRLEILELMKLKTLMEIKARVSNNG